MPIFLIGYMCSGKSTIGSLLAKKMNFNFVDLDSLIEQELGLTISEIFLNKGEKFFRKIERNILTSYAFDNSTIIATGGGTPCFFENNDFMNYSGITIYLKVSCKELVRRLKINYKRPLLFNNKICLNDFVNSQIIHREKYYFRSRFTIESDSISPNQIYNLLKKKL